MTPQRDQINSHQSSTPPVSSKNTPSFPYLFPQLIDSTLYVSIVHIFYIPNDRDHKTLGRSKVHSQQMDSSVKQITTFGQEPGPTQHHSCLLLRRQQVVGTAPSHSASLPGNLAQHPQRPCTVNETLSSPINTSRKTSQDRWYPQATSTIVSEALGSCYLFLQEEQSPFMGELPQTLTAMTESQPWPNLCLTMERTNSACVPSHTIPSAGTPVLSRNMFYRNGVRKQQS